MTHPAPRSAVAPLAATLLAAAAIACAPTPHVEQFATDTRLPTRRLADSTEHLVSWAALAADTAALTAALVGTDTMIEDMRARVLSARSGAEAAALRMTQAVRQGDQLRRDVIAQTRGSRQADEYEHFWLLGREKLTLARAYTDQAVTSADSALGCPETNCTRSRARLLHTHLTSASGAAREAESLVRVAMRYVD